MKTEIIDKLKSGISNINITISPDQIPIDKGLLKEGIIDSFGFVELISFMENEFSIIVEDGDINLENFANLLTISEYILRKKKG